MKFEDVIGLLTKNRSE